MSSKETKSVPVDLTVGQIGAMLRRAAQVERERIVEAVRRRGESACGGFQDDAAKFIEQLPDFNDD